MPGISAEQGATTVNGAGTASFASPQPGLVTGVSVTLSLIGATHNSLLWSIGIPTGSSSELSDATATEPTFEPDLGSDKWVIRLDGYDSGGAVEASYMIPLSVALVALSTFTGPLSLAYVHPTTVDTPGIGQALYQNWAKAGALSAKDSSAVTRQLQVIRSGTTGARPATTYLDTGFMYWDTTLSMPIYWSGSAWLKSDGTSA